MRHNKVVDFNVLVYYRYCLKWYKIVSKRVNSIWWDTVLAPLREMESRATSGMFHLENDHILDNRSMENFPNNAAFLGKSGLEVSKDFGEKTDRESSLRNSLIATRSSLEDMELETRALTEPLPTNQQVSSELVWF